MGRITVKQAAALIGCSEQFIRIGLQQNRLDIGNAVKMSSRWTYSISPARLAEWLGINLEQLKKECGNFAETSTPILRPEGTSAL